LEAKLFTTRTGQLTSSKMETSVTTTAYSPFPNTRVASLKDLVSKFLFELFETLQQIKMSISIDFFLLKTVYMFIVTFKHIRKSRNDLGMLKE
jgi:hypothetical protein